VTRKLHRQADVARILGMSERVRQLRRRPDLPPPVDRWARGDLWAASERSALGSDLRRRESALGAALTLRLREQSEDDSPRRRFLQVDQQPPKVRVSGCPQNSPIRSARSKSGRRRTWRSSARAAGGRRGVHAVGGQARRDASESEPTSPKWVQAKLIRLSSKVTTDTAGGATLA
jgi:hypothetical protein